MIHVLPASSFESNAYVVSGEKVAVIDPGISPERVLSFLDDEGLSLDFVINTHCHFDHSGADEQVLSETGAGLMAFGKDADVLAEGDVSVILSSLFGAKFSPLPVARNLSEGSVIDLGGLELHILHTPGHTRGSMCLLEPESGSLFSGDSVFADGVGRTDFPGGSMSELSSSVDRLCGLVEEGKVSKVFPGHGGTGSGDDILRVRQVFF